MTGSIQQRITAILDRAQVFGGPESLNSDNLADMLVEALGLTEELKPPQGRPMPNRAERRAMARCKHDLATKTDGNGNPWLTVCRKGCGYERVAERGETDRG